MLSAACSTQEVTNSGPDIDTGPEAIDDILERADVHWIKAKDLPPGEEAERQKAAAFALYLMAAEAGDAGAQLMTAVFYEDGWGIAQDYSQALYWWTQAANQGIARAQFSICLLYTSDAADDYLTV